MAPLTAKFPLCLLMVVCVSTVQGLQLVINQPTIIAGQTNNLNLTCDGRNNQGLIAVTFLQLMKVNPGGQSSSLVELIPGAAQPMFVDNSLSLRAQAFGRLDVSQGVFLSVSVSSPLTSDAGTYKCVMSFVDSQHNIGSESAEGKVNGLDFASIGQELLDLRTDVDILKNCTCDTASSGTTKAVAFSSRIFGDDISLSGGNRVTFNVVEFDTDAILDTSSHGFTMPRTGIYTLTLTLVAGKSTSAGAFQADIRVNNISKGTMSMDKLRSYTMALNLKVVKGQEVTVTAQGAQAIFFDHNSYFSGHLIQ